MPDASNDEYTSDELRHGVNPLVHRIEVKGLHGRTDYALDLKTAEENGNISLLYGDNGTGKTTILRLLWDMLSPAPRKGHRTRISHVAFERFSVFMEDATEIRAVRKIPSAGPFQIEIRRRGRIRGKSSWPESDPYEDFLENLPREEWAKYVDREPELAQAVERAKARSDYFDLLRNYGSSPYFLADNRTTSSDEVEDDTAYSDYSKRRRMPTNDADRPKAFANSLASELDQAIRSVTTKLRRLSLGASVQGSAGANSVYMDVMSQLANTTFLEHDAKTTRADLMMRIESSGHRNASFERLGLVPPFSTRDFTRHLKAVSEENLASVRAIMDPFLQSLAARLDALEDARVLIQTLLDEANQYLLDKQIVYKQRSLRIELLNGSSLKTDQLSSGECHILLLLFNAVLASGNVRLFIIDEPELSLNVKWQRRVLRSLLSLTSDTGLQFILATHSIELLSGYRQRVVRLDAINS